MERLPAALAATLVCASCYALRGSSGGGEARLTEPRRAAASDVAVERGYRIEPVIVGLTFPTGIAFDREGRPCVVESGYAYGERFTTPRLLRLEGDGTLATLAEGGQNGPWTGVDWHDGAFYVAEGGALEGGRLLRIGEDGAIEALIEDLPSLGDHHTNGPRVGPDGAVYFGIGTATNSGVVGEDSHAFGWLERSPRFHDVPGADVVLAGENFETEDVLAGKGRARTGAYVPFGTETRAGERVAGSVRCTGSVLRVAARGGEPELVAWGLRNPFGLAFDAQGALWVTDNGYDARGSRPVWGSADFLWRVERGTWYGWPDFVGGIPVTDERFDPPHGPAPGFVLAEHPQKPPTPAARFGCHSSADGFDFSRDEAFGHVGEAFVALFGDQTPVTSKVLGPVGFKVVRVEPASGAIEDFAVNRAGPGPASAHGGGGLERPIAARFDREGRALWVVDFGVLEMHGQKAVPREGTGVVWRVTRDATLTAEARR